MGGASAFCADTTVAISKVLLKGQALDKLEEYEYALKLEQSADKVKIDSLKIWDNVASKKSE